MQALLSLSRAIDALSGWIGRSVSWLIVAMAVICVGNSVILKLLNSSSNAWLELQWWLFAAVFLLAAPWTLRDNEHIRIDVFSSHLPKTVRNWIDVVGHTLFLLPVAAVILYTSWYYFLASLAQNEQSKYAGGLPQWPIKALIPFAFALLLAQGLSELIKRIAIMRGDLQDPEPVHHGYHEAVREAASDRTNT